MIGYYAHHQGRGHQHRALAVAAALDEPVTVLSSAPAPDPLTGSASWVPLERDDRDLAPAEPTAGGRLHWVPLGDAGLRRRMRKVADWLDDTTPRLLVCDVSVEIALLARLHGIPVVSVMLPGRRTDPAHRLGFDVSQALVALWPPEVSTRMLPGLPGEVLDRVQALGGLSRASVRGDRPEPTWTARRPGRVVLMLGAGGHDVDPNAVARAESSTPGWSWTVLDGTPGRWREDPTPLLRAADVVVTHAGQNAIAEVAAARLPAVVIPQRRPHEEQATTANVLGGPRWPALVEDRFPDAGWADRLARAASLDGEAWAGWCDGAAARRFAELLRGAGRLEQPGRAS